MAWPGAWAGARDVLRGLGGVPHQGADPAPRGLHVAGRDGDVRVQVVLHLPRVWQRGREGRGVGRGFGPLCLQKNGTMGSQLPPWLKWMGLLDVCPLHRYASTVGRVSCRRAFAGGICSVQKTRKMAKTLSTPRHLLFVRRNKIGEKTRGEKAVLWRCTIKFYVN